MADTKSTPDDRARQQVADLLAEAIANDDDLGRAEIEQAERDMIQHVNAPRTRDDLLFTLSMVPDADRPAAIRAAIDAIMPLTSAYKAANGCN